MVSADLPRALLEKAEARGLRITISARRLVRVLDPTGEAIEDRVLNREEALPAGRALMQRFADLGHACRPLSDPARSSALLERSRSELSAKQGYRLVAAGTALRDKA